MAKYTTEVRSICESLSGLSESVGYSDIDKVIDGAVPKIFDFHYPIYDEAYRNVLNTKILMHYYTREIGLETVGLWKLKLRTRLNEIMPYYNQMYKSAMLDFNPLYDTDITTTYTKNGNGEKTTTGSENEDLSRNQQSTLEVSQESSATENGSIDRNLDGTSTNDGTEKTTTNDNVVGKITNNESENTVYSGEGTTEDNATRTSTKVYNEEEDTSSTTTTDSTEKTNAEKIETPNVTTKETPEQYTVTQNTTDTKTGTKKTITDNVLWDTPQDNLNWFLTNAPTTVSGSAPVVDENASENVANFMTQAIKNGENTATSDSDIGSGTTTYSGAISTTQTGTTTTTDGGTLEVDSTVDSEGGVSLSGDEEINGTDTRNVNVADSHTNDVTAQGITDSEQTSTGTTDRTSTTEGTRKETEATTHEKENTTTATKNEQQNINDTYQRNLGRTGDEKYTDTTDYIEHITGKRGSVSYSQLVMEYRQTLVNIDMMIINELEDLFFLLWE